MVGIVGRSGFFRVVFPAVEPRQLGIVGRVFRPGVVLFRMMLVKWKLDKMGRGVLAVTVVGMLLVFFLV